MTSFNSARPEQSLQSAHTFDFRALYHTLLEKLWLIVICILVAAFFTGLYIMRAPRIYASTATLQVEQEEDRVVKVEKVREEDLRSQDILRTIEQTLASRPVLERIIMTNNLSKDPRFVGTGPEKPSLDQLVTSLSRMIDVRLRRGTRLIDVTVAHPHPEITALVANSLVRAFVAQSYEQYVAAARTANSFLEDEAKRLKNNWQKSEIALQEYREKAHSVSLVDRQNIVVQRLQELSQNVTQAKALRLRLESEYAQVQKVGTNINALLVVPSVANDPTIQGIQLSLSKMENDFATLKERYKSKHPKYIQAQSQVEELRNSLYRAILQVPKTVYAAYQGALAAEQSLEQALKESEQEVTQLNKMMIPYNELQKEVDSDRALYDQVVSRLKETSLTKDLHLDKIRVAEPAHVPVRPVKPEKGKLLFRGLLAGLVGGVLLALALNAMDSSIKTVDQAEESLHLPVLSAIPQIRDFQSDKHLIVTEDAKSIGAEAIRTLRTSLAMLGRAEDRRVFLFTSAVPEEGKTFCSLNYAVSLSQQGMRTVVIDGDLRRPAVEKALVGKGKPHIGVTDYLTGQKTLKEIIQTNDIENFAYITAGTTAPNPAELLGQKGFTGLIDEALQHFDRVVIDSAPIHAVSDTLLMLDRIQTLSLVVRASKTPRKAVQRAIQTLQKNNAPLAGVILNRLPRRMGIGYYYYDPYYEYSYYGKYAEKGVYGT